MNTVILMNILQSSIINYEIVRKSNAHQQYHQHKEDANNHYFTDKQYRRDDESLYDRRDESSFDRRVEFYRDERDRSNDRFQNRRFTEENNIELQLFDRIKINKRKMHNH
jgi:hypothetical protein